MKRILQLATIGLMAITMMGCVGISYTSTYVLPNGVTNTVSIKANRFIWSTENYAAAINTNGTGTLTANKSNVDAAAITAVGDLVLKAVTTPK
jgi:hypothetical protein